jgi:hypothetical protein
MKKSLAALTINLFLFICSPKILAQTTQTTLNQVELMKQFVGTWQRDIGKDTSDL